MSGQQEALRLAQALEYCDASVARQAINELRRLHTENASLSTGYDAARLEIKSLQAELVKESARTAAEKLRADQMTAQHRMQCNLRRELEEMLAAVGAGGVEPLRKADHFRDATQMVPQGWKLTPVEPTLAMIRAGRDTPLAGEADDDSPEDYRGVYRAMLAAAPEQRADHFRGVTEMIGANEAPARKPLTDRQIQEIWCSARSEGNQTGPFWFAHAIERAHGIT